MGEMQDDIELRVAGNCDLRSVFFFRLLVIREVFFEFEFGDLMIVAASRGVGVKEV